MTAFLALYALVASRLIDNLSLSVEVVMKVLQRVRVAAVMASLHAQRRRLRWKHLHHLGQSGLNLALSVQIGVVRFLTLLNAPMFT